MKKSFYLIIFISLALNHIAQNGAWTQKTDFGGGKRNGAVSFSIGNKGYFGFGADTNNVLYNDLWEYDPTLNIWTQKASCPATPRAYAVAFSIGNKGYAGTGFDGGNTDDFWEYDPVLNLWTQKANCGGGGRADAVGFSIGNKGYIGTGTGTLSFQDDFWQYNPLTNTWTQKANCPVARVDGTGFSIGGKGYIGLGEPAYLNDLHEYDTTTNSWSPKANFIGAARDEASVFVISGKAYVGTGIDNCGSQDFWKFDPVLNSWSAIPNFPGALRSNTSSFSINNKGYVGIGYYYCVSFPSKVFKDFYEFDPSSMTSINVSSRENNFKLFPNPNNGSFKLQINKEIENCEIVLINSLGEKVHQQKISQGQNHIIIHNLASGLYSYIILQDQGQISNGKLTVDKN